jgi:RNA polymerase sigma-70 factor (ECF subfamily)
MSYDLVKKLFKDKMKIIYRYLIKIGCSNDDAQDIIQDTFYKLMIYIDGVDKNNISSWLFKVAINNYYDLCRKQNKSPTIEFESEETIQFLLSNEDSPEQQILKSENREKILNNLNKLNITYKNLILLKYEMELSYKEISKLIDIDEDVAKTYVYRAKKEFIKLWKED